MGVDFLCLERDLVASTAFVCLAILVPFGMGVDVFLVVLVVVDLAVAVSFRSCEVDTLVRALRFFADGAFFDAVAAGLLLARGVFAVADLLRLFEEVADLAADDRVVRVVDLVEVVCFLSDVRFIGGFFLGDLERAA